MTDADPIAAARLRLWPVSAWPPPLRDPIVQCLVLLLVSSLFFVLFPGVDIWFSSLFYLDGVGFPVSRLGAFVGLRDLHRTVTWLVPVLLVAGLILKLAFPWRASLVSARDALFVLASLAIGPGIVTNLIFKDHWGRPRPVETLPFHGDHPFVAAWQVSDACATNCSFISGEGSSAMWLLTFAVLVPLAWRGFALKVLIGFAIALSLNRIAFGGHFLSDVVIGWWINLAIFAALFRLLYVNPPAGFGEADLDAAVGQAGTALRRLGRRARR
jgi:lipid A 4'-phosphatase